MFLLCLRLKLNARIYSDHRLVKVLVNTVRGYRSITLLEIRHCLGANKTGRVNIDEILIQIYYSISADSSTDANFKVSGPTEACNWRSLSVLHPLARHKLLKSAKSLSDLEQHPR